MKLYFGVGLFLASFVVLALMTATVVVIVIEPGAIEYAVDVLSIGALLAIFSFVLGCLLPNIDLDRLVEMGVEA